MKIVQIPNPVLTTPVNPVEKIDNKIKQLVYDMEETLIACVDPQGVGLAAPQVGVSLALFIIRPEEDSDTEVFINPKIIEHETSNIKLDKKAEKKRNEQLEGCLSIPKIWSPVRRPDKVLVEYQDLTGERHTEWVTGFKAVIIQHEVDHLNGILFTQRAVEQNIPLFEEKKDELKKIDF